MSEDRKEYYRQQKAKRRAELKNVDKSVDKSPDEMSTNVHKSESVDNPNVHKAMTYEKQPTVFPGVFTLKPVEVNVIESDWHPSEVERHDIKQGIFTSSGVPTKAPDGKVYVLVAGSIDTNLDGEIEPFSVIAHDDWKAGLERTCMHGLAGWSCKQC